MPPPIFNFQSKYPNYQQWQHWDRKVASGGFEDDAAGETNTLINSESESGYVDASSTVMSEFGTESEDGVGIEGLTPPFAIFLIRRTQPQ